MKVCIQDPRWTDSSYLLEEIIESCEGASSGVGAFAFASASGVKLLLRDPAFSTFLSKSRFELVVGVDAITDTDAIDAIVETVVESPNLSPRVFLGNRPGPIFHPKMCWFRHSSRGVCLVGSGNLTPGGLRGNCEMFSKMDMTKSQLGSLDDGWKTWSRFRAPDLLSLDHPRVRQRALKNAQLNRVSKKLRNDILVEDPKGKISVGPATSDASAVLIAEIPRSGGRWNQANFDLETFSSFFGATPGRTQRIMLTHIDSGGIPGPQEVRPGVAVKSHNYRFELEAASNLPYPSHHRPIAIFVRVATRTFRYRLLMPGTRHYGQVSEYLGKYGLHQANRVRRMLTDIRKLARQPFFEKLAS